MKNTRKNFVLLVCSVIIVIVVGGGFYYLKIGLNKGTNNQVDPTTTNIIAGWNTYTNNQYGFEFQYPPTWKVSINKYESKENIDFGVKTFELYPPKVDINTPNYMGRDYYNVIQFFDTNPFKDQEEFYKSQLQDFKDFGYTIFKFDFQNQKGVAAYTYTPPSEGLSEVCAVSIGLFHNNYLFYMPSAFGEIFAPKEFQKCNKFINPEFKKVFSTFKFIK